MTGATKGAIALSVLGLGVAAGIYFALPYFNASRQVSTSDAVRSKGSITVEMDNFLGYLPLCSPYMRQLMLADGWKLVCIDDNAEYASRFEKLRDGKIDFAVATVDTYVLNGQRTNYPGVIVSVIDESKGGDAILARSDTAKSLTDLRSRLDLKVAFTPDSPSHHLLKAVGVDFDVPLFRSKDLAWQIRTKGSPEAREKLVSGAAQIAVLWEPDVSKALAQPGIVKLLGSEQTSKLIVDILIANREYQNKYPDRVRLVLANYFKTLKYYGDNPDKLRQEAASYASVTKDVAEQMVKGIGWVNLTDNATQWFGVVPTQGQIPSYGLIESIDSTVRIVKEFGDVIGNPLPSGDPRLIINSNVVESLFREGVRPGTGPGGSFLPQATVTNPLEADFPPLDSEGWARLREVATLRLAPILFQSGTNALTLEDKRELDTAVEALKSYPNFRIQVQGHTKPGGDEATNEVLSQERAESVATYLRVTYNIDTDRVLVVGMGSSHPLQRLPSEKDRSYRDRLARVEIHLETEVY